VTAFILLIPLIVIYALLLPMMAQSIRTTLEVRRERAKHAELIRRNEEAFKARKERMYAAGAFYYDACTDQFYGKDRSVMEEV